MRKLIFALVTLLAAQPGSPASSKADGAKKKDPAAAINTPRADARVVAFETSEGTWMSVDLSPDGQTIVFDLLGDIYAVPVSGGPARALTMGPAFDGHPRFSPDGRTIVFTSDRGGIDNLWLMDADGKNARTLTTEKDAYVRSAAWTPDGNYLIARKEDAKRAGIPPVELWIYHRDGGGGIKLTSSDDWNNASGPALSKDGRFVYFAAREGRFNYIPDVSQGLWQIYRYDRTTGDNLKLTQGYGGAGRPEPAPDGRTLAFVSRRDGDTVLILRDLTSGAERVLARGLSRDEQEGFGQLDLWPAYSFTSDGSAILFSSRGKLQRLNVVTGEAREIPFVAQVKQWLAPRVAWQDRIETGPVQGRILRWATQSPDRHWIAFDAFGRVWLQELRDGKPAGQPRRLTKDTPSLPPREYAPTFSPDGQWIAYVTWSDAEGGHVWKAPLTGEPQRLTAAAGHYANPIWSPNGERLSVVRGTGLEFRGRQPEDEDYLEIHWLAATGGEAHFVTSVKLADAHNFHPQAFWSRDGNRLFYRDPIERKKPTDDPKNDLVSVRLDGTDKRKHLRFPAVGDLVPSPDGEWVAFTSRDTVYVAAFPAFAAKEPPEVSLKEAALPVWRLSNEAGGYVGWADAGKTITWSLGRTFYRLPLETAVAFAAEQQRKAEAEKAAEPKKGAGKDGKEKDKAKADDDLELPKAERVEIALTVPRSVPEGSFVLRNVRVVTMKGDEVLADADIVVTGNRIAAVGPAGQVTVPAGAKSVDGRGKTVIPGFVDTHAHLHYSAFEIFPESKWEYLASLAYGVTTVYDPSAPSLDVFAQAEMVEAGTMQGPRVYSSGDVLYGGQQEDIWAQVDSLAAARRQVRRMQAYGARMIKVYQQPGRSQRIWFAEACRDLKMRLTAEGAGELDTDLTMATDGFTSFEHSLPVELWRDVVEFVAKSGTYYTPTLLVSYGGPWGELWFWQNRNAHDDAKLNRFVPHRLIDAKSRRHPWIWPDEYQFMSVARGVAQVERAGGHVSLGAHGQLQGLGAHWELWAMAGEGGDPAKALTPMKALRAATISGADKLGLASDLGSIEVGKLADLIVLNDDPLTDIHNTTKIQWVVKNGELYEAETMRELWPTERPLPPFFWQK